MGWRSLCVALVFLLGCDGCDGCEPAKGAPPARVRSGDLLTHVVADVEMPRCERAATAAAAAWWEVTEGRNLPVRWVGPKAFQLHDPPTGAIAVTHTDTPRPWTAANAYTWLTPDRRHIRAAEIRLSNCDVLAATHEFGHALGFTRHAGRGWLMSPGPDSATWLHP